MNISFSEFVPVRGLCYHVRRWTTGHGASRPRTLFLLHGWMDMSASFQFLVDQLVGDWDIIAPDWRGFGQSQWAEQGQYWFADYLADLDALVDAYSPAEPVTLVGHSLGGNVSITYAGVRPERVASVINLDGFGLPDEAAATARQRLRAWLNQVGKESRMRVYASLEEVARRLRKANPRLAEEAANFLAPHWARQDPDGWCCRADPRHRLPHAMPHRLAEAQACWACIEAPVLHVVARQSDVAPWIKDSQGEISEVRLRERFGTQRDWTFVFVDAAGHMLHQDQPASVARIVEAFLAEAVAASADRSSGVLCG